jgi:hypothetical protein
VLAGWPDVAAGGGGAAVTDDVRTPRTMPQITVPVANLHPAPFNYQSHSETQIEHLAQGLDEIGQFKNIVIWRGADTDLDAGQYYILAGHGLVQAAQAGGFTALEAQDWSALSLDDARRLLVADNETAKLATPDNARLLALVEQVRATGKSVPGVTAERLAELVYAAETEGWYEAGDTGDSRRALGNHKLMIKPVLYADDLAVFEKAILATGLQNRGDAVILICQAYLDAKG